MQSKLFKVFFIISVFLFYKQNVWATTVDEIQSKIDSHSEVIKQLDIEIKQYQGQIEETGKQANTLQNTIKILDTNQKKISTEIKKTETNIKKTNLTLDELAKEINTTKQKIETGKQAIITSLQGINETDNQSFVEIILGTKSLSDAMNQYNEAESFNEGVHLKALELLGYKTEIENKQSETEKKKNELLGLKTDLKDQNTTLINNKKEKTTVLAETKNNEKIYKNILSQKQLQKQQFEKELFDFESALKIAIDPTKYQSAKKGTFFWPLDSIQITQGFGATVDSKRLYKSGTHNGVDFRATRGTPIKAILNGVIQGTGNTDAQRGCYSYGKWILIKHPNGLTSLYGHLDLIKVSAGQDVALGEIIGYSGSTGYATGPHLHLTIYASQGVDVQRYTSSKNCKNVDIPVAPANAYLDPMPYFPSL